MADKNKLIKKTFTYEGLFDFKALFRTMDVWLRDKFYDKWEKRTEEYAQPDGTKYIEFEFTPWKKTTDYYKIIQKIEVWGINVKDVEVTVNGKKMTVQHGKVSLKITGYLVTDYEDKWNDSGMLYFIKEMWDRYVNRAITNKYEKMAIDHVTDLYNTMQAYLNMQGYRKGF